MMKQKVPLQSDEFAFILKEIGQFFHLMAILLELTQDLIRVWGLRSGILVNLQDLIIEPFLLSG